MCNMQEPSKECAVGEKSKGRGDISKRIGTPDSSDSRRRIWGMRGEVGIQKSCTNPRMSGRYLRVC